MTKFNLSRVAGHPTYIGDLENLQNYNIIRSLGLFGFFLNILILWIYSALMQSSPEQATLGKMAAGIIVTDLSGNRISFGKASAKYFASILSVLTLRIGYLMAAWTEKKQTLHNLIAGTLVIQKQ